MYKIIIGLLIITFSLGWLANELYHNPPLRLEHPFPGLPEQASPHQRIRINDLSQTKDHLTINQDNTILVTYTNTNSMDPLLDDNSIGIEIPYQGQKLGIGDIISYTYEEQHLVHRITAIEGTTYTMQGDNSNTTHTIQQKDIKGILIGILY
ncbi:MAG: hypothetical protein Q7R56_02265 [Nanoarchaeota archaeon]|nr:hypothetical protein [Nanoarchaeota archaeon]